MAAAGGGSSIVAMSGVQQRPVAPPKTSGYLPGLDGLRALSVVAVLLYHADMPWLNGGFLGVEVFFVISGYLITLLLTQEHARTSTISLRNFWVRRARRLLAALYTLLATVSVVVLIFYREDANKLAGQIWAALTYVTNWFLILSNQSYFALTERPLAFQHLWSLAIEEQFYLLWPLHPARSAAPLQGSPPAHRRRRHAGCDRLAGVDGLPVPAGRGPQPRLLRHRHPGLGAVARRRPGPRLQARSPLPRDDRVKSMALDYSGLLALGVVLGCFAQFHDTDAFLYRGGFAVLSLASCVAIAAVVHPGTVIGRLLGLPFMVWVGKRSYSLYLWHWPIFIYTQPEIDTPLTLYPTLVLRLVLTVIAAELSYRFIEVPIRNGAFTRWRQRLSRREGARKRTGPIALAVSAGLILLAVNTVGASGPSGLDELTSQGDVPAGSTVPDPGQVTATSSQIGSAESGTVTSTPPGAAASSPTSTPAGAVATTVASTVPAATTTPDPRAKTITVLGDSVLLGAKDQLTAELEASGYTVDYRAKAAQMIHQSNKALLDTNTPVGETVIIGLGHNSLWERDRLNYDKWARKFDGEADVLIQTVESLGAKRIIWVTLREPSESVIPPAGRKQFAAYVWYFPYVNERLRLLPQRHPEVVLADWAAVSNESGLTYDAMHLTKSGIRLMIDTIRTAGGL